MLYICFRFIVVLTTVTCIECFVCGLPTTFAADHTIEQVKANIATSHELLRAQGIHYQDDQIAQVYKMTGDVEKLDSTIHTKRLTRPDGYFVSEMTMMKADATGGKQSTAPDRVTGFTPKYDFVLRANRPGEWILNRCVVVDSPDYNDADRKNHQEILTVPPYDAHYRNVTNVLLTTFFANENVKITSLDKSPTNAGCYRLTYKASGDNLMPGAKIALTMSGWIDIHPELN